MTTPSRLAGVGVFVITGLALFAIALFMIGERQLAFARKLVIYTEFTNITGLQPGAIVRVSGAPAGSVTDIEPPAGPDGKFRVRLEVTEALHQLVRTDSVAAIQTEGLVGGSFLAIAMGTAGAPRAGEGSTISGREPFLLADLFQQMSNTVGKVNATVDDLGAGIRKTLASVDTTVGQANDLIDDISDDVKALASASARITSDAAQIAESIRKGEGTIGRLVKDDELYKRATTIAKGAEDIAADTRQAVQQAQRAIESLQSKGGEVAGLTTSLKDTLSEARSAMAGLSENMEALKRGFFFRGFFNRRGYFSLADISPEEYRKGVLTKDPDRRVTRVWLRDNELFERLSSDGDAEQLTDGAKGRLDEAMAPHLRRLRDTVVMIEGYAHEGSRADQHVVSRARAALVRDYLITRFHLDPGAVGLMPLGAEAVGSPRGSAWSGIALAVFVER
jgi:phospholipid/cholesterol/gamma-HCH transport system substrate-binding protein